MATVLHNTSLIKPFYVFHVYILGHFYAEVIT